MKYFVLLCDGASDHKYAAADDKTPFETAEKPAFNMLSYRSFNGAVSNASKNCPDDKTSAYLSVMSYDPDELTGFASLEAAAAGIELTEEDTAYRCSFVTLSEDEDEYGEKQLIGTDGATKEETAKLISALNKGLSTKIKKFYAADGAGCLVWKRAPENAVLHAPGEAKGKQIKDFLPEGEGAAKILPLFEKSYDILKDHPVNVKRRERGEKPLNSLWLWSASKKPELTAFSEKWKVSAAVISDDPVVKAIAELAGMKYIDLPDADNAAKVKAITDEYNAGTEYVLLHTSAAAQCALDSDFEGKVKAIEDIDANIIAPVYEYLCGCGDQFKMLVTPGMAAVTEDKAYSSEERVPFFMYNSQRTEIGYKPFTETNAQKSGFYLPQGFKFTSFMIRIPEPEKEETPEENGQK